MQWAYNGVGPFFSLQEYNSKYKTTHWMVRLLKKGNDHMHISLTIGWGKLLFWGLFKYKRPHPMYLKSHFCTWKDPKIKVSLTLWWGKDVYEHFPLKKRSILCAPTRYICARAKPSKRSRYGDGFLQSIFFSPHVQCSSISARKCEVNKEVCKHWNIPKLIWK